MRQLQEHIYLAMRIANNLHPHQHAELSAYFAGSLEVMKRALHWAQHLEESLFLLLDTAPPPPPQRPNGRASSPLASPLTPSIVATLPASAFVPAPVPLDAPQLTGSQTSLPVTDRFESPPLMPAGQPIAVPPALPPVLSAAAADAYPADVAPRLAGAYIPSAAPAPSLARDASDLPARVKGYEEEGERLVVRAVEGDAAVMAHVEALKERLEREIQACAVPGLEEFAGRCAAVRAYLDQNIALVQRLRGGHGSDEVERYEAELFRLLHQSSGTDPANIAESTTLRNGLLTLMRELVMYKSVLQKRNAPEDAPVLRRLEDLQENVANFEAEVTYVDRMHSREYT